MNNLDIMIGVLMCIALIVCIIYNVYEIIQAHRYYKNCEEAHKRYLEELINTFKTKEK